MKAIVCTKYGPPNVLQLEDVEKPTPKDTEVLIRVHATTVTAGDCGLRGLKFPLLLQPLVRIGFGFRGQREKILGQELAGEITAVGKEVTRLRRGNQILAWTGLSLGAYAQYTCLPETGVLVTKPSNITYEEAAALAVGGLDAVYLLRRATIQNGDKVLIHGSGGTIGTFAIQLARYFGAHVTAVDSTEKLGSARASLRQTRSLITREKFSRKAVKPMM